MKKKIVLLSVAAGDWEGLYVNGELKCEGHSLSHYDIFKALNINVDFKEISDNEIDRLRWSFPERLDEVKEFNEL